MISGRYPVKAAGVFLDLIKQGVANAENKGLGTPLKIVHLAANEGARPMHAGRKRGHLMKRTHVELILTETEESKKREKKQKKAKEAQKAASPAQKAKEEKFAEKVQELKKEEKVEHKTPDHKVEVKHEAKVEKVEPKVHVEKKSVPKTPKKAKTDVKNDGN